jgi:hypothetical protein
LKQSEKQADKMIGSLFFIFNRLVEIVFLIPIIGMMVSRYTFPAITLHAFTGA